MSTKLEQLVKKAQGVRMTAEDKERQRRSFAYGNTAFENSRITRATIDAEADALNAERAKPKDG